MPDFNSVLVTDEPPERSSDDATRGPRAVNSVRGAATVAGDLSAVFAGRIGAAGLSAGSVIVATRILGPRGYAVLALVGIVANLVWMASTSWTGPAARRYGREQLERLGRMSTITWGRGLIAAPLVATSVLLVILLKATKALPLGLTWMVVVIAVTTSFALMAVDHLTTMVEAGGRMRMSAAVQILGQAGYVGALIAIYASGARVSAVPVLLLSLGASIFVTCALTGLGWRMAIVPIGIDRALLRRILKLSVPMIGFIASQYVFSSVDIVILKLFRGQAAVGVYAVAYQAFAVLSRIAQSIGIVFVPLFVSLQFAGRADVVRRYMARSVGQGVFVIGVCVGLVIPMLPLLVPLMFTRAFAHAAVPMAVLLFGVTFYFASSLVSPVLTLHEQTRAMAIVFAIGTLLNVVGDLLMVAVLGLGIIAPALATSGALACMFVGYYLAARRPLGLRTRVPLCGLVPVSAGLVPSLLWTGISSAIIGVSAVLLTSAAVMIWGGIFTRDDAVLVERMRLPAPVRRLANHILNICG